VSDTTNKISRSIDIANIFGGDHSAQDKLKSTLDASRAKQDQALQDLKDYIENTTEQNKGLWQDYGAGGQAYSDQLDSALNAQKGSYGTLADSLGKYKSVEDMLKGDAPQASQDPQDRLNVQANLSKLSKLTGLQETPEEQLMRMTSRAEQENQLKAQRDATAQSLKERGVYGGGAELASALSAQQEASSRRSMDDVAARAAASQRAMAALGQYQSGAQAANNSDQALSQFNASLTQQNKQAQAQARSTDNTAGAQRATTLNNAATNVNTQQAQNADKVRADKRATVAGTTGVNDKSADQMTGITTMQNGAEATKQAQAIAEQKTGGILSGILDLGW
jgi:hypothetical protein